MVALEQVMSDSGVKLNRTEGVGRRVWGMMVRMAWLWKMIQLQGLGQGSLRIWHVKMGGDLDLTKRWRGRFVDPDLVLTSGGEKVKV